MQTVDPRSEAALEAELARAAEFRAALRRFLRRTEEAAARAGLTHQRYTLLLHIRAAPARRATVTQLVEKLQLSQSSVTELVHRAEEQGLIRRTRSETDGRVVHLELTEEGERRLMAAFTALRSDRAELVRAFGEVGSRLRALALDPP